MNANEKIKEIAKQKAKEWDDVEISSEEALVELEDDFVKAINEYHQWLIVYELPQSATKVVGTDVYNAGHAYHWLKRITEND